MRKWITVFLCLAGFAGEPTAAADSRLGGMKASEAAKWWSFQPLRSDSPPGAAEKGEIDRFIDAGLANSGLTAGPPADRRTLIRRATYDLTGLPPTPAEVDDFIRDDSPDAFARVVDRLLASPHYGEQWGRHWLDVVRYADTAGENTDRPLPHMWRYRNWVFDALNRDTPYADFVKLQLAGDIVRAGAPGPGFSEGIVATGYLALARRFGHDSDKDIHLMHEDVIDNLGKAFLGLSLGCARCHDHKYDPVTMQDYYALYGIFASSRFSFAGCEAKGQPRDLVPMLAKADAEAMRRPWEEKRSRTSPEIASLDRSIGGARDVILKAAGSSLRLLAAGDVPEGGSGSMADGKQAPLDRVVVRAGETLHLAILAKSNHGGDTTRIEWDIAEIGGSQRRWSVADLLDSLPQGNPHVAAAGAAWCFIDWRDGPAFLTEKLEAVNEKAVLKAWRNGDTPSVLVNSAPDAVVAWTTLPARSFFMHPGPNGPVGAEWISPADMEVTISGRVSDAHPGNGDGVAWRLEHLADPGMGDALLTLGRALPEREKLIRQRDAEAGPEPVMPVAFSVVEGEPKNARLHDRGDPEHPGPEVPRRWLTVFGAEPVPAGAGSGRKELADWILRQPLTWRVMANRLWQGHFGRGLVRTANDFGARGEPPTHPELLDWLAAALQREGGRLKPLHRWIMLSEAYRRTSATDNEMLHRDPENRLWSRFDRRRLSAEELRDSLLAVAGNLDMTPGGAHPFPPEKSWAFTQHGPFSAVYDDNRRTAYQMVQRQRRHPFLALFDGADPNATTAVRQTTTAPTQALFFMNDPFFHRQAGVLAEAILGAPDDAARFRELYRRALQREPTDTESALMASLRQSSVNGHDAWAACARVVLAGNEFFHLD